MAYEDNTTVSSEGQEVLNNLFDLIYDQDNNKSLTDTSRFKYSSAEMRSVVERFKKNCPKIVTTMRRFMRGNTHVAYNETGDSGIFVCNPTGSEDPKESGCGRRDFLWWWEFLDFGVYTNPREWASSVGLNTFPMNSYAKENGILVVARLRCNKVRTCDAENGGCGTTYRGSTSCPNPECNKSAAKEVGCGKEHFAYFWVDPEQTWGGYWADSKQSVENNGVSVQDSPELPPNVVSTVAESSGYRNQDYGAAPFFYRMFWAGLPAPNTYLETMDDCSSHLPFLQLGYSGQGRRPNGYKCNKCNEVRYAPPYQEGKWDKQYEIYHSISNYSDSSSYVDQTGGLCINIGDTRGTYAGIDGLFGCKCGGIFEPEQKLPPVKAVSSTGAMSQQLASLEQRLNQGRQKSRILNAIPTSVPISKCRYAFTRVPLSVCNDPAHKGNSFMLGNDWVKANYQPLISGSNNYRRDWKCRACKRTDYHLRHYTRGDYRCRHCGSKDIFEMRTSEVMDYCPVCGPTGDSSFISPQPNGFIAPPSPYTITSPQPLTPTNTMDFSTGQMVSYLGEPQWNLTLKDLSDDKERNNLRIELPQIFLGNWIPQQLDVAKFQSPNDSASRHCPNEEAGPLKKEVDEANKRTKEALKKQQKQGQKSQGQVLTLSDHKTLGLPDVCSGVTPKVGSGYTFLVCEGKSAMGFIPPSGGQYQDKSPNCYYSDGGKIISRPRFTEVPQDNGTVFYPNRKSIKSGETIVGDKYSWCDIDNVDTQAVQDMLGMQNNVISQIVKTVSGSKKVSGCHAMTTVETMKFPQTGITQYRIKCWTCEKIGEIGKDAMARGKAKNLVEALKNDTYYPGYAAIRYYQKVGDLKPDTDIIVGNKVVVSSVPGGLGEDYINGAIEYEQKKMIAKGPGWWNWGIGTDFKDALASGKNIKITGGSSNP